MVVFYRANIIIIGLHINIKKEKLIFVFFNIIHFYLLPYILKNVRYQKSKRG
jgi:hypothetical protein